ncbi:DUF1109 family protein [Prescottella defluvii]|uniref:DUF1109 family protein n=1 Tax=Prescottella defluvii TaxID=1323361 RepID=UPI0004F283D3|nr:DUF1109 family protein [Prescottella defluvii]
MGELQSAAEATNAHSRPPGRVLAAIVGVAVGVVVCIHYDWWPSRFGDARWADPLLFGGAAMLVLAVAGLVWAIRTLYFVGRDRRRSWWVLAAPAMVIAAVAGALFFPPPSFDELRPDFERIALDVIAGPEQSLRDVEIGRFDFHYVQATGGAVYFVEAGGLGITVSSGWAYSPAGPPAGFDDFTATHLGGPWYEFTAVWRT